MTAETTAADSPRLLTVDQVCTVLGIGKRKLYDLIENGDIASVKLPPGTHQAGRRIEESEVTAFIKRNRVQA